MLEKHGTKTELLEERMDRNIFETALVFENKDES